jgi:hypothetical protein
MKPSHPGASRLFSWRYSFSFYRDTHRGVVLPVFRLIQKNRDNKALKIIASEDALTGLYNRASLMKKSSRKLRRVPHMTRRFRY